MSDIQAAYWVGRRAEVAGGGVSTHVSEEVDSVRLDHPVPIECHLIDVIELRWPKEVHIAACVSPVLRATS